LAAGEPHAIIDMPFRLAERLAAATIMTPSRD
jgi:hypothetical protein